jgi:hypothetical protein
MPVIPRPVGGERQSLVEFLRYHHLALRAVSDGLTDEEMARHAGHADLIRASIDGATMFPPRGAGSTTAS